MGRDVVYILSIAYTPRVDLFAKLSYVVYSCGSPGLGTWLVSVLAPELNYT